MTVCNSTVGARKGRSIAIQVLQQRKKAGEVVGRGHKLPNLFSEDLDKLFMVASQRSHEVHFAS